MSDKEHPHFPDTTAAAVPTLRLCVKCGFCQPQSDESDTCFACAHPPTAVPQAGSENLREIYECEKCDLCEDHYAPRIVGEEKSDGGTD